MWSSPVDLVFNPQAISIVMSWKKYSWQVKSSLSQLVSGTTTTRCWLSAHGWLTADRCQCGAVDDVAHRLQRSCPVLPWQAVAQAVILRSPLHHLWRLEHELLPPRLVPGGLVGLWRQFRTDVGACVVSWLCVKLHTSEAFSCELGQSAL